MEIRLLSQQELLPALHLVWEVFAQDVASSWTPEGVEEFRKFIKYENIAPMFERKEQVFFGAFDGGQMAGVIAVGADGLISLFFVRKSCQRKGIGKLLFQTVYNYGVQQLCVREIRVHATPEAVPAYERMGMHVDGPESLENGIPFVPMSVIASAGLVQPVRAKSRIPVIAAVVAAGLLVALILIGGVFLIRNIYQGIQERVQDSQVWEQPEDGQEDFFDIPGDGSDGWDGGDEGPQISGLDGVPAYVAEDLPYEIQEESYEFTDTEKQSTLIQFQIPYPVLEGLDPAVEAQVNEAIRDCALAKVEELYTSPTEEIKERVLTEQTPVLASTGSYKICFAGEDFISIAFEDQSYEGSMDVVNMDLRTINISLQDGKVYQVEDIVKLDETFVADWLEVMREEADNDGFLEEADPKELIQALKGQDESGVYTPNFFVDSQGVEIGFDLNYPEGDANDLGYIWVTAPYSFQEAQKFSTDSEFWDLIQMD